MEATTAGRFSCKSCGKSYRWKPEFAGKRVKCVQCGQVIQAPLKSPAPPIREDTYDLAPDTAPPPMRPKPRPVPANAEDAPISPVAPQPVIAAPVKPVRKSLAYRTPKDDAAKGGYFPDKTKDLYMPLWLIGGSTAVEFGVVAFAAWNVRGAFFMTAAGMTAQLVLGTFFMLVGVLIAARVRGLNLGPFGVAVLKLAAISVAPGALMTFMGIFLNHLPLIGPLINWVIGFCMYFALIGALFDLDQSDTWYCVCVIFLVKLVTFFAVAFGIGWMMLR